MKHLSLIVPLLFSVVATYSSANEIPGADDPSLRSAALAWLTADDPAVGIAALGSIASNGNIAARVLTNRIDRRFGYLDFPNLSRAERRQLLPPDNVQRASGFSPYPVDRSLLPSTVANQQMAGAETPEEWIAGAQILIDAGLMGQLKTELRVALGNRPELDIEALKFAEGYVVDDEYLRGSIWMFRALDQMKIEFRETFEPSRAFLRRERWKQEPWSSDQYADFSQALADGRWAAIRALGSLRPFAIEAKIDLADVSSEAIEKWADLAFSVALSKPGDSIEVSNADLDALGQLIPTDAVRSTYLQPLLNSCVTHCPNDLTVCLASGVPGGLDRLQLVNYGFDPFISSDEYLASRRASRELTAMYGLTSRDADPTRPRFAMP